MSVASIGIWTRMMDHSTDFASSGIRENTVTMPDVAGGTLFGIAGEGDLDHLIYDNMVTTASNSNSISKIGIHQGTTVSGRPWCNTLEDVPFALHYHGVNTPAYPVRNRMIGSLAGLTLNNGQINNIGVNGHPWDNTWEEGLLYETYALNSVASQHTIRYRNTGGIYEPVNNTAVNGTTPFPLWEFTPQSTTGSFPEIGFSDGASFQLVSVVFGGNWEKRR